MPGVTGVTGMIWMTGITLTNGMATMTGITRMTRKTGVTVLNGNGDYDNRND